MQWRVDDDDDYIPPSKFSENQDESIIDEPTETQDEDISDDPNTLHSTIEGAATLMSTSNVQSSI